eukprot:g2377.t1
MFISSYKLYLIAYLARAARRQRPKSATASRAPALPKHEVPVALVDSVMSQIVRDWGSARKASLAVEIDLRKQLRAQAQRIIALEAELADASIAAEQQDSTSDVTKAESFKHKVDGTEDIGTNQIGSITLSPSSKDMEECDIHILLNSYTAPRWRAKSEQLGMILAESILDKIHHFVENEAMQITLCCFMGEDGDRIIKSILRNAHNRSWVEVNGSCTCFCISLDKAAVKSLIDAKLDGGQSFNGLGKHSVFQSAGTLLLDLIGSHMLMLVDWYVGDVEERYGHAIMC